MDRTPDTLFGNVDWWYFLSLSQTSMSLPSPTWDIEPEDEQAFSILLTVYSKVKKLLQGKSTLKEEKSVKMKELFFYDQTLEPGVC